MTWTAAIAVVKLLWVPVLKPVLALLTGWLLPSPLQKVQKGQADNRAAEQKADETRGQVDDLDKLP